MFKLIAMSFNELWRADELRLQEVKKGNQAFESVVVVQKKFDGSITFAASEIIGPLGVPQKEFLRSLCGRIFQSQPLSRNKEYSSAFEDTLSALGIFRPFLQQIADMLQPGFSLLIILVENHMAESMQTLANQSGGKVIQTDVWNNEVDQLDRSVGDKIANLVKAQKKQV